MAKSSTKQAVTGTNNKKSDKMVAAVKHADAKPLPHSLKVMFRKRILRLQVQVPRQVPPHTVNFDTSDARHLHLDTFKSGQRWLLHVAYPDGIAIKTDPEPEAEFDRGTLTCDLPIADWGELKQRHREWQQAQAGGGGKASAAPAAVAAAAAPVAVVKTTQKKDNKRKEVHFSTDDDSDMDDVEVQAPAKKTNSNNNKKQKTAAEQPQSAKQQQQKQVAEYQVIRGDGDDSEKKAKKVSGKKGKVFPTTAAALQILDDIDGKSSKKIAQKLKAETDRYQHEEAHVAETQAKKLLRQQKKLEAKQVIKQRIVEQKTLKRDDKRRDAMIREQDGDSKGNGSNGVKKGFNKGKR
jgi:hypothetical protein